MVVLLRRRRRLPGVDPHPFGHGRAADAVTTRIEAAALYEVFNPADFAKEWTGDEVGRVAGALVGLSLPFDLCNLALDPDCPRSSGIQFARGL